jgi:hypothetical protein
MCSALCGESVEEKGLWNCVSGLIVLHADGRLVFFRCSDVFDSAFGFKKEAPV